MEEKLEENELIYDFVCMICLKNQLLEYPLEKLLDAYGDYDNFILFLESALLLMNNDSAFLLFSCEALQKVSAVVENYRFTYRDSEITNMCNEIIVYLNTISNYSEKLSNSLMEEYLNYQEDCRKISILDCNILLDALSNDALVYSAFVNNDLQVLEGREALNISSINYFLEVCPELFENDDFYKITLEELEKLAVKGWPFNRVNRIYSKETINILEKVKKKGE